MRFYFCHNVCCVVAVQLRLSSPYNRYSLSLIPPDTENLEKKPFQVIDFYSKTHLVLSAAHAFGPGGLSAVTNN